MILVRYGKTTATCTCLISECFISRKTVYTQPCIDFIKIAIKFTNEDYLL